MLLLTMAPKIWFLILVVILTKLIGSVKSANILALVAVTSHSHLIWNRVLIDELAKRGHNLTVLSSEKSKSPPLPNVHYIVLEKSYDGLLESTGVNDGMEEYIYGFKKSGIFEYTFLMDAYFHQSCNNFLSSNGLQSLINYPNNFKFDLVIYDYTMGPCLLGFLDKFNYPPMIGVTAFNNPPYTIDLVGGHMYPAYIPFYYLDFTTQMTFRRRMINTIIYYWNHLYKHLVMLPQTDKLVRKYFDKNMPYIGDFEQLTKLVLVNSHPATNFAEPTPPNVIEVGGLHITQPKKLPPGMADFIEKSVNGAVLVSLGSNIRSEDLGLTKCQIMMDVMASFPKYNFLWKISGDFFKKSFAKNIMISNWLPQQDILAHPKTKVFITHAGSLSTSEATWFGVPMVGIPIFVDQEQNLRRSIELGVAVHVDVLNLTYDNLHYALKRVIDDPKFTINMKKRSALYRDRPMKPLDTAIWWIDFVLRTPTMDHLKSPVLKMGFWRANGYDVLILIAAVIIFFIWLILKGLQKIVNYFNSTQKLCKSKNSKKTQ